VQKVKQWGVVVGKERRSEGKVMGPERDGSAGSGTGSVQLNWSSRRSIKHYFLGFSNLIFSAHLLSYPRIPLFPLKSWKQNTRTLMNLHGSDAVAGGPRGCAAVP